MKVIALCSGGMDSVAALYQAHRDHKVIAVLSFHYGSKHNDREIPFAVHHASWRPLVTNPSPHPTTSDSPIPLPLPPDSL